MKLLIASLLLVASVCFAVDAPKPQSPKIDSELALDQLNVLKAQKVMIARQKAIQEEGIQAQSDQLDKQIAQLQATVDSAKK